MSHETVETRNAACHAGSREQNAAALDGLLIVDKPSGLSSAKALDRVRRLTRQRKSGHAGTLDPAATGVLIICLGKATRLVESLMDLPKVYRAEARLDVTSAGFDMEDPLIAVEVEDNPDERALRQVFASFVGLIEQVPPERSAVKIKGRPAYERARAGSPVVLQPRQVRIDRIDVLEFRWPRVRFAMTCGRGTYVRSLIRDVGLKLRTGGCLASLERLAVGSFTIEESLRLTDSTDSQEALSRVIPIELARDRIAQAAHASRHSHGVGGS